MLKKTIIETELPTLSSDALDSQALCELAQEMTTLAYEGFTMSVKITVTPPERGGFDQKRAWLVFTKEEK